MLPNINDQIKDKSNPLNFPKEGQYNSINGHEIIQYQKIDILGKGAFGIVFSAVNHKGDLIAVKHKKEPKDVTLSVITNQLFSEELESLSQLNHPNIVSLLGVEFSFRGPVSIIMEYIEGVNLEKVIKSNGRLSEMKIKSYTAQLLDAITYLHAKHLIHRDIKSTNVMIVADIYLKLIDLGMAKKTYSSPYSTQLDSCSTVVGTIAYMAPELLTFDKYNATVDCYSLGVLVYEMANGQPYYGSKSSPIPLCRVPDLLSIPSLSSMANNFIHNCLIKDYKIRPRAATLRLHPFVSR